MTSSNTTSSNISKSIEHTKKELSINKVTINSNSDIYIDEL